MKSRITIDFRGVDVMPSGQQFEPVIKVIAEDSEDVRDGLVKAFFEALGTRSNWLVADFNQETLFGKEKKYITITPVRPGELQETINIIKDRLPAVKEDKTVERLLPSRFQIGDSVIYATDEKVNKAFEEAKKLQPDVPSSDIEYTPDYTMGKVVAVRFTEGKVWYDILNDITGQVNRDIVSHQTKSMGPANTIMPKENITN